MTTAMAHFAAFAMVFVLRKPQERPHMGSRAACHMCLAARNSPNKAEENFTHCLFFQPALTDFLPWLQELYCSCNSRCWGSGQGRAIVCPHQQLSLAAKLPKQKGLLDILCRCGSGHSGLLFQLQQRRDSDSHWDSISLSGNQGVGH